MAFSKSVSFDTPKYLSPILDIKFLSTNDCSKLAISFNNSFASFESGLILSNLPKIAADLRESQNSTLVAINQLRSAISQYAPDTLVGGRAQSYQAHLMLELRKEGYMTVDKERQGHYIRTKLTKTKVGGKTDSSVLIPFHYEGGIDDVEISIEAALKKKIIQILLS